jgi:hypothetical protein
MKNYNQTDSKNLKVTIVVDEDKARIAAMKQKSYLKKKYRLALKFSAMMDLHEFAQTHPEWGAKDVLVEIMKNYFSDFPPVIVLEMAEYIVTEWEKIQASKKELVLT